MKIDTLRLISMMRAEDNEDRINLYLGSMSGMAGAIGGMRIADGFNEARKGLKDSEEIVLKAKSDLKKVKADLTLTRTVAAEAETAKAEAEATLAKKEVELTETKNLLTGKDAEIATLNTALAAAQSDLARTDRRQLERAPGALRFFRLFASGFILSEESGTLTIVSRQPQLSSEQDINDALEEFFSTLRTLPGNVTSEPKLDASGAIVVTGTVREPSDTGDDG